MTTRHVCTVELIRVTDSEGTVTYWEPSPGERLVATIPADEETDADATDDEVLLAIRKRMEQAERELAREGRQHARTIAERDLRHNQIDAIADALGDTSEWTDLNDRGDRALELATALQERAEKGDDARRAFALSQSDCKKLQERAEKERDALRAELDQLRSERDALKDAAHLYAESYAAAGRDLAAASAELDRVRPVVAECRALLTYLDGRVRSDGSEDEAERGRLDAYGYVRARLRAALPTPGGEP